MHHPDCQTPLAGPGSFWHLSSKWNYGGRKITGGVCCSVFPDASSPCAKGKCQSQGQCPQPSLYRGIQWSSVKFPCPRLFLFGAKAVFCSIQRTSTHQDEVNSAPSRGFGSLALQPARQMGSESKFRHSWLLEQTSLQRQ